MPSAAEWLPLTGRAARVHGDGAAAIHARALLEGWGARLADGPNCLGAVEADGTAAQDWARSGAMGLTGALDGPPLGARGAPASALRAALLVFDMLTTSAGVNETSLLGERAAIAGLSRNAPQSVGGAFRFLRAADGWVGVSLVRPSDIDSVPALIEKGVYDDPWGALASWAGDGHTEDVAARAQLLGVPAAPLGAGPPRRAPVTGRTGGRRQSRAVPIVMDLSALWAGPLCAHLLGLAGCRVIKLESIGRPDGARRGPAEFYDLLHAGHESVALDFTDAADLRRLRALLANADVVIEASRPRALRQLGIDADELVQAGVVWASITAYGRTGPWSDRVGFGNDVAAAAGLVADRDGDPWPAGDALADPLAGAHAAASVAAGLRSGAGCLLDVSMYDVAAAAAALPGGRCTPRWTKSGWYVDDVRVAEPRARGTTGRAPELGADTDAVLRELT